MLIVCHSRCISHISHVSVRMFVADEGRDLAIYIEGQNEVVGTWKIDDESEDVCLAELREVRAQLLACHSVSTLRPRIWRDVYLV